MSSRGDPLTYESGEPHHFRLELPGDVTRDAVADTLDRFARHIAWPLLIGKDARLWIDVDVPSRTRTEAILGPIQRLRLARIDVLDFVPVDVVEAPSEDWLLEALELWRRFKNGGPGRRRLEACAGKNAIDTFGRWIDDHEWNAAFAMGCAAFNTPVPGAYAALVTEAASQTRRGRQGRQPAATLLDAASNMATLASLLVHRAATPLPEGQLPDLIINDWWDVQGSAINALGNAPGVLSALATERLCTVVADERTMAPEAAHALRRSAATDHVESILRHAFGAGHGELRRQAATTYCALWSTEGRFVWTDLLSRSHPFDRSLGHVLLARYGSPEDVPAASKELMRVAKTKTKRNYVPPLGHELVEFLLEHSGEPSAAHALKSLQGSRDKMAPGFRAWVEANHPMLFGTE